MVGNLVRDIEIRYLQTGTAVASSAIAVNKKFKTASGEMRDDTCFIDVTFWGRTAEVVNQYLRKGSKLLIEGELKQDKWQDQNGQNRSKHSVTVSNIQMLDSKRDDNSQGNNSNSGGNNSYNNNSYQNNQNSSNQNQNNSNQNSSNQNQNSYSNQSKSANYYQDNQSTNNQASQNKPSENYNNVQTPVKDIDIDEAKMPF